MSLFIKGMNMPEYRDIYGNGVGNVHILMLSVNKDGSAFVYCNDSNKEYCTVSEIPTPHGRLIDASKLPIELVDEDGICAAVCFSGDIEEASTIIEAEE